MEGGMEMIKFIKVWLSVAVLLCYCYGIGSLVPKGGKRLPFVLPVVCIFLYLPLLLSSAHLGGTTAFFIAWLANFKLLLFAFGKGPLCSDPSISLPLFVAVACLPIKIHKKENPYSENYTHVHHHHQNAQSAYKLIKMSRSEGPLNYAIKGLLSAALVRVYDYSDSIHPKIILLLYAFHMYFILELILAVTAALARSTLGLELEPQFNEPYLSTSLQDFWGKRWNLMVTSILRPTVYKPTLHVFTSVIGPKWAPLPAVFATFLVSGLMHELEFYYLGLGQIKPTGEVMWFFVFHGFCLMVEISVKKALTGNYRLPGWFSGLLTVAFVMVTGCWWFFPHIVRYKLDVRAFEEYAALGAFMKNATQNILGVYNFYDEFNAYLSHYG
uniref:Acyltransferase 4 n=1 Tax=Boswellia serrata TaxID=613112 RepID=A0A8F5M6W4_BOSSE|nr:acyltransferase 4 [Boswellia serrata]